MLVLIRNLICLIALLVLFPIIVICGLLVIIEDGLPVIFKQARLGKDKEEFMIYKLRTMKKNVPSLGTHEIDSTLYLRVGSLLRISKLDELPQLFNVISGDLNLVGPRPGLPNQTDLKESRANKNIFLIKPGITGLGQVTGYNMSNPPLLSEVDKVYMDSKSMLLDIKILIATFTPLFRKQLKQFVLKRINHV
tara:strand:+ start:20220 stop:20798 length:579 start_codon:yes stop_codon:yes gene_type:complete